MSPDPRQKIGVCRLWVLDFISVDQSYIQLARVSGHVSGTPCVGV